MTRAQWNASIEGLGVLTVEMGLGHLQQALNDGDMQLATNVTTGISATGAQITARTNLKWGAEIYSSAVFGLGQGASILSLTTRNQLITQGDNYYAVTGAP